MYPTPTHSKDCDYHLDQYPWECTCGAIERFKAEEDNRLKDEASK